MTFVRAIALGLATGSRSSLGLAALVVSGRWGRRRSPDSSWTNSPLTVGIALTGTAGELVADKLPRTPSRLEPRGLIPRLVLGAAAGGILAHREGYSQAQTVLAGALGLAGAAAGARLGALWRRRAADKLGQDLPGALIEDAAALTTAKLAVL